MLSRCRGGHPRHPVFRLIEICLLSDDVQDKEDGQQPRPQNRHWMTRLNRTYTQHPCSHCAWIGLAATSFADWLVMIGRSWEHGDPYRNCNYMRNPARAILMDLDLLPPWQRHEHTKLLTTLPTRLAAAKRMLEHGMRKGVGVLEPPRQVVAAVRQARIACNAVRQRSASALDQEEAQVPWSKASSCGALTDFADWLQAIYLPLVDRRHVPDAVGSARYRWAAEQQLGIDASTLDFEAIYHQALADFEKASARLIGNCAAACERFGWECQTENLRASIALGPEVPEMVAETPLARMARVLTVQRPAPPNASAFSDFVAKLIQRAADWVETKGLFDPIPEPVRRVQVRKSPISLMSAFFVRANVDFFRAGRIYYSLERLSTMPFFTEVTTAFHEGIPGHALQLQLTLLNPCAQLSLLDQLGKNGCNGFIEGWAFYAEGLMGEQGAYDDLFADPEEATIFRLGMEWMQLFRLVRVILDTGIHLSFRAPPNFLVHGGQTWNYERAVDLMVAVGFPRAYGESEVLRYTADPAQAITYRIGQQKILQLRKRAARERGRDERDADFLRDFHRTLLQWGSVRLDKLEELWSNRAAFVRPCACASRALY